MKRGKCFVTFYRPFSLFTLCLHLASFNMWISFIDHIWALTVSRVANLGKKIGHFPRFSQKYSLTLRKTQYFSPGQANSNSAVPKTALFPDSGTRNVKNQCTRNRIFVDSHKMSKFSPDIGNPDFEKATPARRTEDKNQMKVHMRLTQVY